MPEIIQTPRNIPLIRIQTKAAHGIDPRKQASIPIHTPTMERMTRQEQIAVRKMDRLQYKDSDGVMGQIMTDMMDLHGETSDKDERWKKVDFSPIVGTIPSTPRSPETFPQTAMDKNKAGKRKITATNDPNTKRPKFSAKPASTRQNVKPWRPTSRRGFSRRPEHNYSKKLPEASSDNDQDTTTTNQTRMEFLIKKQTMKHSNKHKKKKGIKRGNSSTEVKPSYVRIKKLNHEDLKEMKQV